MLVQLAGYFEKNLPDHMLYVNCDAEIEGFYKEMCQDFSNVRLIQCKLRCIPNFDVSFDCIILLGGSTLMGNRNIGALYRFLNCMLFRKLRKHGTKYAIVGCNTGPFLNGLTELLVKKELNCAGLVTTRDKASLSFITKSSCNNRAVHYYPDIVLGLRQSVYEGGNRFGLGIAIHGPSGERTHTFLTSLCDSYISKTGNQVKLLCFDVGKEDDISLAEMVVGNIKNKEMVSIVKHEASGLTIIKELASCDRILAIRFHAAILAIVCNIPFLTISYSNKMRNFMQDIGCFDKDLPIANVNKIAAGELVEKIIYSPVIPKAEWRTDSNGHFLKLSEFLAENKFKRSL